MLCPLLPTCPHPAPLAPLLADCGNRSRLRLTELREGVVDLGAGALATYVGHLEVGEGTVREYESTSPNFNKNDGNYYVERMFYSSKQNSCICVLVYESNPLKGNLFARVQVIDALTKEELKSNMFSGELGKMTDFVNAQMKSLE